MKPAKLPGKAALTAEMLRHYLRYDARAGIFTRSVQTTPAVRVGDIAGTVARNGYVQIQVAGGLHYAHRLAWLYVTGTFPAHQIDHINGDRSDNRWGNLRDATLSLNQQNRKRAKAGSKSGLLGVSESFGKWEGRIFVDGKQIRLGRFDTPNEAHAAYVNAKRRLHAGCTI